MRLVAILTIRMMRKMLLEKEEERRLMEIQSSACTTRYVELVMTNGLNGGSVITHADIPDLTSCHCCLPLSQVNRVRNRWKCILRDGVANIDGRDYLFSRCNTEFEW